MNLPPKPPRFVLPVAGAKVGSIARPVADGATSTSPPTGAHSAGLTSTKPRFGLRSNTRTLASISSRQESRLPVRASSMPEGSLPDIDLPDGEVA